MFQPRSPTIRKRAASISTAKKYDPRSCCSFSTGTRTLKSSRSSALPRSWLNLKRRRPHDPKPHRPDRLASRRREWADLFEARAQHLIRRTELLSRYSYPPVTEFGVGTAFPLTGGLRKQEA